jgi:hypothetical protein
MRIAVLLCVLWVSVPLCLKAGAAAESDSTEHGVPSKLDTGAPIPDALSSPIGMGSHGSSVRGTAAKPELAGRIAGSGAQTRARGAPYGNAKVTRPAAGVLVHGRALQRRGQMSNDGTNDARAARDGAGSLIPKADTRPSYFKVTAPPVRYQGSSIRGISGNAVVNPRSNNLAILGASMPGRAVPNVSINGSAFRRAR